MQNMRKCIVQGHQYAFSCRICTFKDCNLQTRWLCAECLVEQIHQHGQVDQYHLMKQDQFRIFVQQELSKCVNNKQQQIFQQSIVQLGQILSDIGQLLDNTQQFQMMKQKEYTLMRQLLLQSTNDFILIDTLQVNELLNFAKGFETKGFQDLILCIISSFQQLSHLVIDENKKYSEKIRIVSQSVISLKQSETQIIDYQDYFSLKKAKDITAISISPNEKQIALSANNATLEIHDLSTKRLIFKYPLQDILQSCIYSQDSSLLFCGDQQGRLYRIRATPNIKELNYINLHNTSIRDIKLITNDNLITCSNQSIKITDVKQNVQFLKIPQDQGDMISIEYDQNNETIISISRDLKFPIKIYNLAGDVLITLKNPNLDNVYQIQLVKNDYLLTRQEKSLILWQINYKNRQIIEIKKFTSSGDDLCYFQSVLNHTRILKFYPLYLQIIDYNCNIIQDQQHTVEIFQSNLSYNYFTRKQVLQSI